MEHIELGKKGEKIAVSFLKKRKYKIVERNYRCPFGEIDIVAKEGDVLVFVEVKTRRSQDFGLPKDSIVKHKMKRMYRAALCYMNEKRIWNKQARFDVISIVIRKDGKKDIELIKDAFSKEDF